ncbi:MAG: hypothetical protein JSS69_14405 [Acidobacteria bacterium]|nr:hypothetical protein [Acidobacteriota bacterium]MBS1867103.1 hypothetical protein [Acidobacteriota bacterium]
MLESRRKALTLLGTAASFLAVNQLAPAFAAQHPSPPPPPQPKPSPNAPISQNAPLGLDGPQTTQHPQTPGELNRQLQMNLRIEVDKLWLLTNELREEVMRANPSETLSVDFLKKAQAIEKMAKQIREHAKG